LSALLRIAPMQKSTVPPDVPRKVKVTGAEDIFIQQLGELHT